MWKGKHAFNPHLGKIDPEILNPTESRYLLKSHPRPRGQEAHYADPLRLTDSPRLTISRRLADSQKLADSLRPSVERLVESDRLINGF